MVCYNKQMDVNLISPNLRLHDPKWLVTGIAYGIGRPHVGELQQGPGFLHGSEAETWRSFMVFHIQMAGKWMFTPKSWFIMIYDHYLI
jgi:hypothetical protein